MRHVPEAKPADHFAQAERTMLIKLAGDRGDSAEALAVQLVTNPVTIRVKLKDSPTTR